MWPVEVDTYPASYGQESLWTESGLSAVNVPAVLRLRGNLSLRRVRDVLDTLCARHDAFRTVLARDVRGVLEQRVARSGTIDLVAVQHNGLAVDAFPGLLLAGAERPFPVDGGPLALAELHSFGSLDHVLIVWLHHAISDLASSQVVVDDLRHLFLGADPGPVRYQPSRFAVQERGVRIGSRLARYWTGAIASADRRLGVPRPRGRMHRGIRPALPRLSTAVVDSLTLLAAERRTTITAVLAAAMITGHVPEATGERVLVGLTKSNRDSPRLRSVVGCLADQLPLVVDVGGDPTFAELVGRVRESMIDAFDHRAPLGALLPVLGCGEAPVFAVNLNFLPPRQAIPEPRGTDDLEVLDLAFPAGLVKARPDPWWLGEAVLDYRPRIDRHGLAGELEGDAGVHEPETVAWFGERFSALLETVAEVPGLRLGELTATVRAQ
ncbi:condensation domain-containing protein [Actinophytocola sp.]|jgi:hypothetical protein|uniref:condensation domain-containing protein n=1 Tax=Actinophytocola sp. TaxID=1872138 RepID=UPI002ED9C4D2